MHALIQLDEVSVYGVDTRARARSLRQALIRRKSMRPKRIPILQNVTFHAKPGDRIGIIGMNGSGKSSLLKVVSANYPIHSGRRQVQGSIVPLIEMGAGFQPECTGRHNIKLTYGYRGRLRDYDKAVEALIIEFSELGEKIDLPLKTYSSGMVARLAFLPPFFNSRIFYCWMKFLPPGMPGLSIKHGGC